MAVFIQRTLEFYYLYFEDLRILFVFKIFRQSKYILGFMKFWGIFVLDNFSKKFFQSWSNFEKTTKITKIGKY